MTRGQMAEMLRRRLQDVAEEAFDDATMNTYLNSGLRYLQKEILKLDKEAFFEIAQADIVAADLGLIEKPSNMIHEIALKVLDASTGKYRRIERISYDEAINRTSGEQKYAHHGAFFLLSPAPATNVTAGLELAHCPILSMSGDSDVPVLNINLHEGIVYAAEIFARAETGEGASANVTKAEKDLALVVNNIPLYYIRSAADPLKIDLSMSLRKDPY